MSWKYPLSDIDLGKEEEREVLKVLRSRWLSTGPVTGRFEEAFAEALGGGYAVAVSNGTAALHLALAGLGLKRGDEVIVPSLTFVATANAVLYTGARPVFAEVTGSHDLDLSPADVERKITDRTRAIVVMHYAGFPCDMGRILRIARAHDLRVVEDAAHAPGAEYRGRRCGLIGDAGCFSFFSNKNLVTGEGGAVVTCDKDLAERVRRLRSHGMKALSWDKYRGRLASYDIDLLGYNYRTTEIQSALGLVQLRKLEANNRKRGELVGAYRKALAGVPEISIPFSRFRGSPSWHIFPVLVEADRDGLMAGLKEAGIQTSVHYPPAHLFSLYRRRHGQKAGALPMTEDLSRRELTLPLHPRMTERDVEKISAVLISLVKK